MWGTTSPRPSLWEPMSLVITSPLAVKECNRLLPPPLSEVVALGQSEVWRKEGLFGGRRLVLVWAGWGLLKRKMSHQPPSIHSAVHGDPGIIYSFSQISGHPQSVTIKARSSPLAEVSWPAPPSLNPLLWGNLHIRAAGGAGGRKCRFCMYIFSLF